MSTQLQLEELHRQASADYLRGDFAAAMDAWGKVLEIEPGDERAEEGIRLCKQLVPEGAPEASGSEKPSTEDAAPYEFDVLPDDPPEAAEPNSAASELTRRVDGLLASAREQSDAGQRDAALRTLGRLLILDDQNAEARELQAQLRGDDAAAPQVEESVADVCDKLFLDDVEETLADPAPLSMPADDPVPAPPEAAAPPSPPEAALPSNPPEAAAPAAAEPGQPMPLLELDSEPDMDINDLLDSMPGAAGKGGAESPPGKAKLALPPWLADRRLQYGLAGLVLILLVFAGMQFMGGGEPLPVDEPLPVRAAKQANQKPADAEDPAVAGQAPAQQATQPDPRRLIEEGEAAFIEQNYAAAVIAFGKVLEQMPDEAAVRARLDTAAKLYREQEEKRLAWEEAVAAFEGQNFGQALRLVYRMDQADYEADLQRIKINGWYNHGVNALRMSRCDDAWEHFNEARSLDATDEAILDGLAFAGECDASAIQVALRSSLAFRGMED